MKEQENNKGSIKAPGKKGEETNSERMVKGVRDFFYYCLKISRERITQERLSILIWREQTQKALSNKSMLVVLIIIFLIRVTSRQVTALPSHLG